jgi:UDP-N-acetylmuramoylalanine--D-glutamate ligase
MNLKYVALFADREISAAAHGVFVEYTVIVGAGKSGLAAARYLSCSGLPCLLTDSNPSPGSDVLAQLAELGVECVWGSHPDFLLNAAAEIVLSPVVDTKIPFVEEALQRGIPVIGELELAHRALRQKDPSAMVLAITGTNGKSTTTDLAAHLLRAAGLPAVACGNLGFPFLDAVQDAPLGTRFVVECSSYQLETVAGFRANAAAILNLTPDHLARHKTMEAYLAAKLRIFERQSADDLCIIPSIAPYLSKFMPSAKVATFGCSEIPGPGAWCEAGGLFIRDAEGSRASLISRAELLIPGDHNVENALAAALLAANGGAPIEALRSGLKTYPGLAHRLAFCGEKNGIRAYNDSKGTNVDASLTAIRSLTGPLVMLLGGEDKGSSYGPLREALEGKLRLLVFLGDAIPMLERDLGDLPHSSHWAFDDAVTHALSSALQGDQVLLSPACASFDQFKNFEARGERFELLVSEWQSL